MLYKYNEDLEEGIYNGLCYLWAIVKKSSFANFSRLPEVIYLKHKPNSYAQYWWKQCDSESRIQFLNDCIKLVKQAKY